MRLEAMAFDVDGTLVDSNALHAEAWHQVLFRHGFAVPFPEVLGHIGMGGDKLIPALTGKSPEEGEARRMREETPRELARLVCERGLRVFPGAREVLEGLRSRGVPFAIATSGRRDDFDLVVRSSGLDLGAGAATVITGDDARESKPEPDLVERAIAGLQVPPHSCAFVGDTPFDATAAVRAGARAIGVLQGAHTEKTLREAGALFVYPDLLALARALPVLLGEAVREAPWSAPHQAR
jgi:HAD superfamily hydrolase (TIGR01509 family)